MKWPRSSTGGDEQSALHAEQGDLLQRVGRIRYLWRHSGHRQSDLRPRWIDHERIFINSLDTTIGAPAELIDYTADSATARLRNDESADNTAEKIRLLSEGIILKLHPNACCFVPSI